VGCVCGEGRQGVCGVQVGVCGVGLLDTVKCFNNELYLVLFCS
jgi:hypothetical protein